MPAKVNEVAFDAVSVRVVGIVGCGGRQSRRSSGNPAEVSKVNEVALGIFSWECQR